MRIIKFLAVIVIAIVLIIVALPLWIGPVVTTTTNVMGPKYTKSPLHLGKFAFNPYSGHLEIGDLQIMNPEGCGYSERAACTVGNLSVDFDTTSLMTDVIHIRLIRLDDFFASYINSSQGTNNVDHLLANAGVGKKGEAGSNVNNEPTEATAKPSPKVIIDRIEVNGVLVQLGPLPIKLPQFAINNIGKATDGVELEAAWNDICTQFVKFITDNAVNLGKLGKTATKETLKTVEEVGKGFKSIFKDVRKSLKDSLK